MTKKGVPKLGPNEDPLAALKAHKISTLPLRIDGQVVGRLFRAAKSNKIVFRLAGSNSFESGSALRSRIAEVAKLPITKIEESLTLANTGLTKVYPKTIVKAKKEKKERTVIKLEV
jgi:hypothetical protein